jgi:tRNA pseudouridine55 synthase
MKCLRSGVLLVDKPAGMSSADLTNQLKRKHRFDKIGHGGTLDPFATGLLVVLLGEATKVARFMLEGDKGYEAVALLGAETDTGDHTGEVIRQCEQPELSLEQWMAHAGAFTGFIRQTPPAYSAVKVKGRPLYDYARKGEAVEAKSRDVQIKSFEILEASKERLRFRVLCSGGTYIRVLASDLARAAGTCAHLVELRRISSSSFRVNSALNLESALATPAEELPLFSIEAALSHLPRVVCKPEIAQRVRQGNLAALETLRSQLEKPGYFLLLEPVAEGKDAPVAVCNHHPLLQPSCTIERVFDPKLAQT